MTPKETVLDRLQRLPDDATLEAIRDEVDIMIAVEEGLEDFRQGRSYSFQQVIEMSESWTTQPSGQTVQ